jgi:hypothetical protein
MSRTKLHVVPDPSTRVEDDAVACVQKIFTVGKDAYLRLVEVEQDDEAFDAAIRGLSQSELGAADLYAGSVRGSVFICRMLVFEDGRRAGHREARHGGVV